MNELGLDVPYWVTVMIWLAKVVLLTFVSAFLAWLGIRALDALTPHIPHRERIGEDPVAIGLFVGGFFIMIGLVLHGAITALTARITIHLPFTPVPITLTPVRPAPRPGFAG